MRYKPLLSAPVPCRLASPEKFNLNNLPASTQMPIYTCNDWMVSCALSLKNSISTIYPIHNDYKTEFKESLLEHLDKNLLVHIVWRISKYWLRKTTTLRSAQTWPVQNVRSSPSFDASKSELEYDLFCFVYYLYYWCSDVIRKTRQTHLGITIQSNDAVSIHLISHYYEGARKNYNRFAYLTEKTIQHIPFRCIAIFYTHWKHWKLFIPLFFYLEYRNTYQEIYFSSH